MSITALDARTLLTGENAFPVVLDDNDNLSEDAQSLLKKYQLVISEGLGILGIKPKLKMWVKN